MEESVFAAVPDTYNDRNISRVKPISDDVGTSTEGDKQFTTLGVVGHRAARARGSNKRVCAIQNRLSGLCGGGGVLVMKKGLKTLDVGKGLGEPECIRHYFGRSAGCPEAKLLSQFDAVW